MRLRDGAWLKSVSEALSETNKMADNDIIIGRVINITGAIGVLSGIILFFSGIVLLVFRRGFGFDIANSFHWFW